MLQEDERRELNRESVDQTRMSFCSWLGCLYKLAPGRLLPRTREHVLSSPPSFPTCSFNCQTCLCVILPIITVFPQCPEIQADP